MKKQAIINWSGGKDSSLALFKILQNNDFKISCLLTSINSESNRISMHGVRESLLQNQVESIGFPLHKLLLSDKSSMATYEKCLIEKLGLLKAGGNDYSVFGDIFLEDLREYREKQLERVEIKAVFPLWKMNTEKLVRKFISLGFKAIITAVDDRKLGKEFTGRIINQQFLDELPEYVDPCGENGEFHSFVFDGPIFSKPIQFIRGKIVHKTYKPHKDMNNNDEYKHPANHSGFWFCDLIPA